MRRGGLVLLALLALAGWLVVRDAPPAGEVAGDAEVEPEAGGTKPSPRAARAPSPTPPGKRPASLRGTRPDGKLELDAQGRFRPSPLARLYFDYWLSVAGEEPAAHTRRRIVNGIWRRLPPAAAAEAEAFLDRYLAYRAKARDLRLPDGTDPAALEARLAAVQALRVEVFGAGDAAATFGDEEARDRAALARRRALDDPTLDPAARAEALAAADALLPEDARAAHDAATLPSRLEAVEKAIRAVGGDAQALRRAREELVGREAASRLAALDQERAAWDGRLAAFRAARAAIMGERGRPVAEREAMVAALLEESFSEGERVRVEALDRVAAGR
ncbi:MAG: lipase chaperone [bacterium]|nr:lipase chaperone [bacterium]